MKETKEFLKSIGLPAGDAYDLPVSEKKFADGAQYRFEVPGICLLYTSRKCNILPGGFLIWIKTLIRSR